MARWNEIHVCQYHYEPLLAFLSNLIYKLYIPYLSQNKYIMISHVLNNSAKFICPHAHGFDLWNIHQYDITLRKIELYLIKISSPKSH